MAEGSVITEKGRALLGKILATNSTLNITGAQIGSGDLPAGTPPASMTALASYVMDATIVAISPRGGRSQGRTAGAVQRRGNGVSCQGSCAAGV